MQPPSLPPALQADLQIVERIVRERISAQPVVAEMLRTVGVKDEPLLRAAVALLCAQLGSYDLRRAQHVASTVELIRRAAQIHDGLVDQAARRRGAESLRAPWSHGVPLMVGDYMYALAAGEMALVDNPRAITYFSEAVKEICEAALTPVLALAPFEQAQADYLAQASGRTGALFAAAARAGCAVAGCPTPVIDAAGRYGQSLGLALQVAADADAYGATSAHSNGAVVYTMRQGIITLPLIYAAASDPRLGAAIDDASADPGRVAWVLEQVRAHGVAPAHATARRLRDDALAALAPFVGHPAHQQLAAFANGLVA